MSCNCGCGGCQTKIQGPLLTEGKVKSLLSEGLQYHIDKKIPLFETVYRIGSEKHLSLIKEARKMYSRNVIDLCEEDEALIKTHLGEFALYEGESVPLDLPMLNEKGADTAWEDEEGNKVTLQDILDMTKNVPQKDYPTEKLAKVVLNWDDNPEEVERIDQVEISKQYPILIMVDEAGKIQWILDGNHRAQKALRSKAETIPAKLIKPSMLDAKSKKVLLGVVDENMLNEDKKLTYNNFVQMTRDDMMVGAAPDEYPSDERVRKYAKALYSRYLKGASVDDLFEAEFKGKDVPLNKPKRGGSKAYYVYVRDPKTKKVKKVSFGSGGLRAKIKNKEARNAFAKRHNCKNKKDRTKAGYWSCNLPRYASALGLGANMNTFW